MLTILFIPGLDIEKVFPKNSSTIRFVLNPLGDADVVSEFQKLFRSFDECRKFQWQKLRSNTFLINFFVSIFLWIFYYPRKNIKVEINFLIL